MKKSKKEQKRKVVKTWPATTATIVALFDKLGGAQKAAKKIGVTANTLHISKSRGYLPKTHKYEIMLCAKRVGMKLPDDLFDPVKAAA